MRREDLDLPGARPQPEELRGKRDRDRLGLRGHLVEPRHGRLLAGRQAERRRQEAHPQRVGSAYVQTDGELRCPGEAATVVGDGHEQLERGVPGRRDRLRPGDDRVARATRVLRRRGGEVRAVFSKRLHARRILLRGPGLLELRIWALRPLGRDDPPIDRREGRSHGRAERRPDRPIRASDGDPARCLSRIGRLPREFASRRASDGIRKPAVWLGVGGGRASGPPVGGRTVVELVHAGRVRLREFRFARRSPRECGRRTSSPRLVSRRGHSDLPTGIRRKQRPGRRLERWAQRRAPQPQRRGIVRRRIGRRHAAGRPRVRGLHRANV